MRQLKDYGFFALAGLFVLAALAAGGEFEGYPLMGWLAAALAVCAGLIQRSPRRGILATAALCFGANAYLFSRKLAAESGHSICNISEVLNCDVINSSAASEAFGVPITLFGMGFYLGLAIASMLAPRTTPRLFQVDTLFAIVSLIYSAYLAYESKQIGAVCVLCITMYIGNGLLLWAGIAGMRAANTKLGDNLGAAATSTSMLAIAGTFAIIVLIGSSTWTSRGRAPSGIASGGGGGGGGGAAGGDLSELMAQPRGPVSLDGTEPVLGDPQAPYLVVEWADYACPHCARAGSNLKQLVAQFPEIQVRFKAFPLSGACNPAIGTDTGTERCHAAAAAKCAQPQGKFWDMSGLLFANQTHLADDDLLFMAKQIGLDIDQWAACMEAPATADSLRRDAEAGAAAGVRGTPAMYLRGTHGGDWVEILWGAEGVMRLVEAHKSGAVLPPPGPPREM